MLFSQRFGYAVHAMCYVAKKRGGALTTLPELAGWMRTLWPGCSETYLSAVVQRLVGGGLLRSQRGVSGGYALARSAENVSLRDLVELLEGVDTGRCGLSLEDQCPLEGNCAIRRKIGRIEESFLRSLEEITIAQLARELAIDRSKVASS